MDEYPRGKKSEEELFVEYRNGNSEAMEIILSKISGPLYGTILKQVGDKSAAEDIFQETLERVVRHRGKYDPSRPLRSWVWTIAMRLGVDHLRRKTRDAVTDNPEARADISQDPESTAIARETLERASKALGELTPEQRQVFLFREEAGLSFARISEVTGRPLGTVLTQMHTALKKLRKALEE